MNEWSGAVFDPQSLRHFSILPDEDGGEAYCVRHDRDMRQIDPLVHTQGALYTTAANVSVYSCPACCAEIGRQVADAEDIEQGGVKAYRVALMRAFDRWDDGDAQGDWFQYVSEGGINTDDEGGTSLVTVGHDGDGGEQQDIETGGEDQ